MGKWWYNFFDANAHTCLTCRSRYIVSYNSSPFLTSLCILEPRSKFPPKTDNDGEGES